MLCREEALVLAVLVVTVSQLERCFGCFLIYLFCCNVLYLQNEKKITGQGCGGV